MLFYPAGKPLEFKNEGHIQEHKQFLISLIYRNPNYQIKKTN